MSDIEEKIQFTEQDKRNISAVFELAVKQLVNDPNGVDRVSIHNTLVLESRILLYINQQSRDLSVPEDELDE